MNHLYVGLHKKIALPPMRYLFIDDEVPNLPQSRVFDPTKHSFNPLKNISHTRARELADALYAISPQGQNTLTVRDGKRALYAGFLTTTRLDKFKAPPKMKGAEEAREMIKDLLRSPVLKNVLCNPAPGFSLNAESIILARINRKELGNFDALVLTLFLINAFKGQIIIPDFGYYGREAHINLITENRLIAGVNFLDELPLPLKRAVLLITDKTASHALYEDAEILAKYEGLRPGTNGSNSYIDAAIA